jgi:hypothetical protein
MGVGTNVQKRLAALHHLDAPWKPAEVEQREGRILRQGNENEEVSVYRYVTEGSFDAYMWQALETKARFISQVMSGDNGLRRAEDIGGQELSYAEVKAIASGNPAVLTLSEADAELQRLNVLKKNHADEQYLARRNVRDLPESINRLKKRLANLTEDMNTAKDDRIVIGNQRATDDTAKDMLAAQLENIPVKVMQTGRFSLGVYRGLRFGIILHQQWNPEVYLEGAGVRQEQLSRDHHGPRAILNALERMVSSYGPSCQHTRNELALSEKQLQDYQARLGQPFTHEAYISKLTALRDQLKASLSGHTPEGAPTSADIAGAIKALKAENTIEAAPARTATRRTNAEEPVTARIRRQMEPATFQERVGQSERVNAR